MTDKFKKNLIVFISVLLMVVAEISLPFFTNLLPDLINEVNIVSASADVNKYELENEKSVYLTGEWEFFWGEHIISDMVENPQVDAFVQVPSSWTTYNINGQKLSNGGTASYRINLKNVNSNKPFVVSVPNLSGECKIFINGEYVFSNRGIPGTHSTAAVESYVVPFSFAQGEENNCEIVIEMTCDFSSGLTSVPTLSTYESFRLGELGTIAQRYFYIGIVIFIAIAVMLLGVLNKDIGGQFWLFVLCFAFAFRMLITNEGYMISHGLFGNLNYEIMTSLIYVSTYIIKLSMLMHLINVLGIKIKHSAISEAKTLMHQNRNPRGCDFC